MSAHQTALTQPILSTHGLKASRSLARFCALASMALACLLPWFAHAHAQGAPPSCIAIMGTNDVHGAIEPYTIYGATPGLAVRSGGVLAASAYIDNMRRAFGARSLVLDAGDIFQGTLPSNMSLGKAMIDAYNAAGYDAAAIGNHEFDFGALPGQDANIAARRLGVLQQRIREAKFPFLAVNIFDRDTGRLIDWDNVKPSVLRDVGGIKVGIIGASTPTTPYVTKSQNVETLEFRPPAPLVLQEAQALRAQGAQFIILVAHMGGRCGNPHAINSLADPRDIKLCEAAPQAAELMDLLQTLPQGSIDIAIGGHTHQFIAHWVNGVATLESGSRGQYMGWVEACLLPAKPGQNAQKRIDMHKTSIHGAQELCLQTWDDGTCWPGVASTAVHPAAFLAQPLVPNAQVKQVVTPYLQTVATLAHKPVGAFMAAETPRSVVCEWVGEAMRRATHSHFGLQNRGGVRTELPAGNLSYGDIYGVLPFDNYVAQAQLTGRQITRLADHMLRYSKGPEGPVFIGLHVMQTPNGATVVLTNKDQPLDPNGLYTLSTTDFMLQGGDGADVVFKDVPKSRMQIADLSMRDAFLAFLAQNFAAQAAPQHAAK